VLFADECVPEVTAQVQQLISRPGNQSRRNVKHIIYVRNNSGRRLNGLVHFIFDALPLGRKYTSIGVGRSDLVWLPGQTIRLEVDFFNPNRVPLNYRLRIYTGPGYP
jgi:hypothetical protein